MRFAYSADYFPPAPSVSIYLGLPEKALTIGPLPAFVDTGADVTVVPLPLIEPLGVQIDNRKVIRSQWGERRSVDTYPVDLGLGEARLPLVEIVGDERGTEVILGRNVLNKLVLTLDGPKRELEVSG